MSARTGIEWTDATWNPVRGCRRVSPGCENCYAERMAARFCDVGQPYHQIAKRTDNGGRWTGAGRLVPGHLADPLHWRRPRRVFVNSMSDLFFEAFSNEEIAAVFGVMAAAPRHTFQVLTKRPKRMREWFQWIRSTNAAWLTCRVNMLDHVTPPRDDFGPMTVTPWPLPNVWLGVSVEDQQRWNERVPLLLETPAAVRFVSAEPLLGPVNMAVGPMHAVPPGLGWVIVGCESGPGARPMEEWWARGLRTQCAVAAVPFFYKQAIDGGNLVSLPMLDGVQYAEFPR